MGAVPKSSTGVRSRSVSKPMFGISAGFTAWVSKTSTQVLPSGAARAVAAVPSEPEAPVRFSTTTGTPNSAESLGCSSRDSASVLPPGGKGTMMRIGPFGQAAVWASAGAASATAPAASMWRRVSIDWFLPAPISRATEGSVNHRLTGRSGFCRRRSRMTLRRPIPGGLLLRQQP